MLENDSANGVIIDQTVKSQKLVQLNHNEETSLARERENKAVVGREKETKERESGRLKKKKWDGRVQI